MNEGDLQRLLTLAQSGARGFTTGLLGAPVDIANTLMAGAGGQQPVMGSQWIGNKLHGLGLLSPKPQDTPGKVAEFVGGLLNPSIEISGPAKVMGLLGAIKAYHGSPHKFDAFDISKIGTGEGNQTFGHGLYFAENPDTAMHYQRNLATQKATRDAFPGDIMAAQLVQGGVSDEKALAALQRAQPMLSRPDAQSYLDAGKQMLEQQKGNLYETSLRWPDPAQEAANPLGPQHFIDWDKPLSKQSPHVQDAIKRAPFDAGPFEGFDPRGAEIPDMAAAYVAGPWTPSVRGAASTQQAASNLLRDLGIPGIKYLDGVSRGTGQGTSNYVVFDDALAQIMRRHGQP